jgi:geranylgeranyl diphosphate synthase type II
MLLTEFIKQTHAEIDSLIKSCFPSREPHYLYEPIAYTLGNGGKKIRPVLLRIIATYTKATKANTLAAAAGIELFHIFSLVHDDIMDNDRLRRGKETVHVRWDSATAILAGDGLIAMANSMIAKVDNANFRAVIDTYNQAVLDVCEGQAFDKEFEKRSNVLLDEYLNMIRLKTACLLAAAAKIGALVGNASTEEANNFYQFGINLGMAFQIQDDILDLYADEATLGKDIGSDVKNNKMSVLTILAKAENIDLNAEPKEDARTHIQRIKKLLEEKGLREKASKIKNEYSIKARHFLDALDEGNAKDLLIELVEKLNVRRS